MSVIDEFGRPEPPPVAAEIDMLVGYLDWQRATLEWKTRGLDGAGLSLTIARLAMTLGGILKHMAWVEDHWFSYFLHERPRCEPWASIDWASEPNWEWTSAVDDTPQELRAIWRGAVEASRVALTEALRTSGLDQLARRTWPNGEAPSLRWIIIHMIEEYARHNGHADLLREAVDGETGE